MKAAVVTAYGGPDVLQVASLPVPTPGPRQVGVAVEFAGVNYRDIKERQDPRHGFAGPPPFVAGIEGVGHVVEVGSQVTEAAVGDRVGWWFGPGSYAERVVIDADQTFRLPVDLDAATCCAATTQGLTAHALSHSTAPLEPGDWAVVHAAAGGVGALLVQLLTIRGVRVLATASSDHKLELARSAGAEVAVPYADALATATDLTGGVGVRAVFDSVGKDTFQDSLRLAGSRGWVVLYGSASGPIGPVDPVSLAPGSKHLTWIRLPDYVTPHEQLVDRAAEVLGLVRDGRLHVRIDRVCDLGDAGDAQLALEQREATGKVLLRTGGSA